jgi:hypothetical protein
MASVLDAAGVCAERGLHVIPVWRAAHGTCACPRGEQCVSPGKHPAIDSWQTAASIDLVTLRDWFAADRHNIGVVCGPSNVVVVDVDPRNGGKETFDALVAELGALPQTVTADTGGGGAHYVFRRPTGELESKLGKGVDLLRDSRQFLVEPSIHPSGMQYRWRQGCAPDEAHIATLPDAWIKRIRRQVRRPVAMPVIVTTDARIERARRYLAKLPPAISGAGGHSQMFNAVCVAMFGFDLDPDAVFGLVDEYNQRCDPPFNERELHHKIRSAAEHCNRERGYLLKPNREPITSSQQASSVTPLADDANEWTAGIIPKRDGTAKKLYCNAEIFVRLSPDYRGKWALNTMTGEPWFDGAPVRETFIHQVRAHVETRLGFTPPVADVKAAILVSAEQRSFHPVRQYLDSIDWDGQPRLLDIAREHLGTDRPLHAEMVKRWMIGAVARALRPGCKLDTALMLHGKQGLGKSSFFSVLGQPWHSDSAIDINNKDAYQQIHSAWLYEFSELENVVAGRQESRLKAFMTSTHDSFRAPYAAVVTSRPRSMALCGTTNRREILTDDTGSRRFWIVPVAIEIDRELLAYSRDQLWAEARAAYESGEPWWFGRDLEAQREAANEDFDTDDAWAEPISEWLQSPLITEVSVGRLLTDAIKLEPARQDRASQMRAAKVLRKLGWQRHRDGRTLKWNYRRPSPQESMDLS